MSGPSRDSDAPPPPPVGVATLPSALESKTKRLRLGGKIPALLAHPDWASPAPALIWLHGRTVSKEIDNGRFLRLIRAGIAVCAIDLPGHGERFEAPLQQPSGTMDLLERALPEIDSVVEALAEAPAHGLFDRSRLALGCMSAGGMITLRRLADPHTFIAATVEGTAGDLRRLYLDAPLSGRLARHDPKRIAAVDPLPRIPGYRPIPLLALHSRADEVVPVEGIESFVAALRAHYQRQGADPTLVQLHTWPRTGAPLEHNGFGRVASEAKTLHVEFLRRAFGLGA